MPKPSTSNIWPKILAAIAGSRARVSSYKLPGLCQRSKLLPQQIALVQATFFFRFIFPPPATLALVLTGINRPGAGLAANGNKTALVQRVIGHFIGADIVPHLLRAPIGQRIKLGQSGARTSKVPVVLNHRNTCACTRALVFALSCNPGTQRVQLFA